MANYELNIPGNLLSSLLNEQNGLAQLVEAVLNQILDAQASEQVGQVLLNNTRVIAWEGPAPAPE